MDSIYNKDYSRNSYTDDEDQASRMSDIDCDKDFFQGRRSPSSSLPASPSSSYKMSVDSDDGRSMSSVSVGRSYNTQRHFDISSLLSEQRTSTKSTLSPTNTTDYDNTDIIPSNGTSASGTSTVNNHHARGDDYKGSRSRKGATNKRNMDNWSTFAESAISSHDEVMSYSTEETEKVKKEPPVVRDPERRIVSRRSGSLLPKSKALLRVMDQEDEDTHLADIEMRREQAATIHLKLSDDESVKSTPQSVPIAAWTKITSPSMTPYQCSKLNPELEMTNFQLENLPSPIQQSFKNIKRKASEDFLDSYSSSIKRRAVSPSVSLTGSPVLTALSSPPTCFAPYGSSNASNNAAARAHQKVSQLTPNAFNLHDASGGLSRMSLSE